GRRPQGPHVRHGARGGLGQHHELRGRWRALLELAAAADRKAHWHEKWRAVDAYLNDIRGILTRVGDETVGEMWSLYDGRDVLNEIDPRFGDNIDGTFAECWSRTSFTSRRTPIRRATVPSAHRIRTLT